MKAITDYFNEKIKSRIVDVYSQNSIAEIRMRINKPMILNCVGSEIVFDDMVITKEDINDTFNIATEYSAYAYEQNIKEGFLSVPGGHRIGFGGTAVINNNEISALKNIMFLNIRVCREIENCSKNLYEKIIDREEIKNTLIISPPGLGKTTLLRDLIKKISNLVIGTSICVIDERNEISGIYRGVPTIDLGKRTDIISNCGKKEGVLMAIRSMGPKVIAIDEIGGTGDMEAVKYAGVSGVAVIATIHGKNIEDIKNKFGQDLLKLFEKKVVIIKRGEYICY